MIVLDPARMETRAEAHLYLQEQLSFPDYYGKNLDALYDCLTELDETEVAFLPADCSPDSYFHRIYPVFEEAAEDNPKLLLCECCTEPAE